MRLFVALEAVAAPVLCTVVFSTINSFTQYCCVPGMFCIGLFDKNDLQEGRIPTYRLLKVVQMSRKNACRGI